jgi:hypothetical protein
MRCSLRILRLRAMLLQGLATGLTAGTLEAGLEMNWQKEGKDGKDPEREEAGWKGLRGGVVARLLRARARAL